MVSKLQEASLKKQEEERGTQAQEKCLLFSIFFFSEPWLSACGILILLPRDQNHAHCLGIMES